MTKVIDSANFTFSNPTQTSRMLNYTQVTSDVGVMNMLANGVNATSCIINSASEEDFLISGVFLQTLSFSNGYAVVDLAKKNGATYPKVTHFLHRLPNDQVSVVHDSTGRKYSKYDKGQALDLFVLNEESVAFTATVVCDGSVAIGDLLMLSDDGLKVKKAIAGRDTVGKAMTSGVNSIITMKIFLK